MASSDNDEKNLLDLFDEGFKIFNFVSDTEEPTNSLCVQNKVKQAMRIFEEATRVTSAAGIFSSNEGVEEISTENLRLFLLPALLGSLALKLTGNSNRMEIVETSDTYFRDFLQRSNDYGVSQVEIPPPEELVQSEETPPQKRCTFDIMSAAKSRAHKIQRYNEEKALQKELSDLLKAVKNPNVDDETKREYYLKLIKSYVNKAEEELDCLQTEKKILIHMKNNAKNDSMASSEDNKRKGKIPAPKPLKPVIITKDEVQKAVYGAGYPSLPTMTVQEFYDKRVRDGIFPDPTKQGPSLMSMAQQGMSRQDEEEAEQAEKDEKMERDDEMELNRQRAMDEFKDETKRGQGNRYNRS